MKRLRQEIIRHEKNMRHATNLFNLFATETLARIRAERSEGELTRRTIANLPCQNSRPPE